MTELIVALDYPNDTLAYDYAIESLEDLDQTIWYKIGLELFVGSGMKFVNELQKNNCNIFLDLKLYDIEDTIIKTVLNVMRNDVDMLTICALDRNILSGAKKAKEIYEKQKSKPPKTKIIIVGITTNNKLPDRNIVDLPALCDFYDLDGVVCPANYVSSIKSTYPDMICISPAIRHEGDDINCHDKTNVFTPEFAKEQGVDYIVVGRPITAQEDIVSAYNSFVEVL